MSWKKFYSLKKLIREGKRLAADCHTISFDLFDTLLIRRIHDPDLVKLPVARYIAALACDAGIQLPWQRIQKIRDRIEKLQREETGTRFDDHEACYPIFMKKTLSEIFQERYTDALLEEVTNYELAVESSMLVPRQELVEWLQELHDLRKRIFIISDIYLPSSHLKILAERAGLLCYAEDLISSADTFLAKASGKAFELIEKQYGLDTSSWLHIGDNPFSDGLKPSEFGLSALVLHDASEKHRKAMVKRYVKYSEGRFFYRGRALQQLMLPLEGENIERPALYIEGYNFLGPMIGAFVQHIAEESRRLGITKIFFLSREGYTFKNVWNACVPTLFPDKKLPEVEYLYVSRMALAGASCAYEGLTQNNIGVAFLPSGNRDFRDVARIFQFDIERLQPHLERHQLEADTCLTPRHEGYDENASIRLLELLEDEAFQDEVKRQSLPASTALFRYLENVEFFKHEQVAIVDIGWLGTIQTFLYDAIKHRSDCPRLHGFLFAATRGVPFQKDLRNGMEGVLYDRHRFDLAASTILYARDVFEEACRAPHPTLEGYDLTEEGYELRFRRTDDTTGQAEKEQDHYFAPLQQGILDAAQRYGAASALLGYSLEDYRPWFNYLMTTKLAFPSASEVLNIRHKHHLDDFHGNHQPADQKSLAPKQLWDSSLWNLRLNPLLRVRFFWRHIRDVIRS